MSKFLISESEKRRIIQMHKNATSKHYLFEQSQTVDLNRKISESYTKLANMNAASTSTWQQMHQNLPPFEGTRFGVHSNGTQLLFGAFTQNWDPISILWGNVRKNSAINVLGVPSSKVTPSLTDTKEYGGLPFWFNAATHYVPKGKQDARPTKEKYVEFLSQYVQPLTDFCNLVPQGAKIDRYFGNGTPYSEDTSILGFWIVGGDKPA